MPLKIAITGSNGLVGTGVVLASLKAGHSVLALDLGETGNQPESEHYSYHQLDACDYEKYKELVKAAGCDAMVHLAASFNRHVNGVLTTALGSHIVYNTNSAMSWNTLEIAGELGIDRVVLASSVNSIGMVYSKRPKFDYLPVDEDHPFYPEDAYSVSKYVCEIQADAFCRRYPSLRIATLRFHAVIPDERCTAPLLEARIGSWKDLWGWVSVTATAQSCLLGLTAPLSTFPIGHETFFIVAPTTVQQRNSEELLKEKFPELVGKMEFKGNEGFISTKKAERMLGWKEVFSNSMTG